MVKFAHQATWRISNSEEIAAYIPTGEPGELNWPLMSRERKMKVVSSAGFVSLSLLCVLYKYSCVSCVCLLSYNGLFVCLGVQQVLCMLLEDPTLL